MASSFYLPGLKSKPRLKYSEGDGCRNEQGGVGPGRQNLRFDRFRSAGEQPEAGNGYSACERSGMASLQGERGEPQSGDQQRNHKGERRRTDEHLRLSPRAKPDARGEQRPQRKQRPDGDKRPFSPNSNRQESSRGKYKSHNPRAAALPLWKECPNNVVGDAQPGNTPSRKPQRRARERRRKAESEQTAEPGHRADHHTMPPGKPVPTGAQSTAPPCIPEPVPEIDAPYREKQCRRNLRRAGYRCAPKDQHLPKSSHKRGVQARVVNRQKKPEKPRHPRLIHHGRTPSGRRKR